MITPSETARLALDGMAANLDRLRTSLTGVSANATSAVGAANARAQAAEYDAERFKADYLAACKTIADMHAAATGRTGEGPHRGVVEDVADVRTRAEQAEAERDELHATLGLAPGQLHSAALSAIRGRAANIRELVTRAKQAEQRIRNLEQQVAELRRCNTNQAETIREMGFRAGKAEKRGNHWKAKAEEIEQDRDRLATDVEQWQATYGPNAVLATCARMERAERRAEQAERDRDHEAATREQAQQRLAVVEDWNSNQRGTVAEAVAKATKAEAALRRVRDAETLAQALAAVAEHDGLTPQQAADTAAFATAAETPAAIDAERDRAHALKVATLETLLDVQRRQLAAILARPASTPFELLTDETARILTRNGQRLLDAEQRLDEQRRRADYRGAQLAHALADAERYQAAWHNARLRAKQATERAELITARAKRNRESRNRWTRQALDAKAAITRVRGLLDSDLGPLATAAVRRALDATTGTQS